MSLAFGARLGPYEVLAPLGAGGMGEVYRARDPRLGREVAIKVLPAALSADPERLRRFEQEARAAAALNHSNVLAVHDVGQHEGSPYIVSELLEGDTLRERLSTGPLPVRKAVEHAVQIAHGLAAAHEKGITHRDLKPENIFITSDGRVKILDFGLAKLTQPEAAAAGVSALSTTPANTAAGMVLGTAGYMSPEQMRGLPADQRSDIFAFGAVLYEMLSGVRAFHGDTYADTISAILKEDPPDLPVADRHIPPALVRIVDRCLAKSPSVRFQSAGDLGFALEGLSSQETVAIPRPTWAGIARERIAWTFFVVALVAALVLGGLTYVGRAPSDAPVLKATILQPPGAVITERSVAQGGAPGRRLGISPDGQRLAFTAAGRDGVIRLWVRRLDSLRAQELDGTEGAVYPFWSPDSKWLAFFSEGRGRIRSRLMKIDPSGGSPTTLCDLPGPVTNGGTWSRNDVILFALGTGSTEGRIHRVSAAGGTPSPITKLDAASGEAKHYTPHFLPDGRRFLYLAVGVPKDDVSGFNVKGLYVGSLDSDDRTLLMSSGSIAKFANGHLLFMRGSTLMAQRFDPVSLKLGDQAVPIAEDVLFGGPTGMAGAFTVSDNGTLAYQTGALLSSQLTWFDRDGKRLGVVGEAGLYGDLALAPDGSRVAVTMGFNSSSSETNSDIWVYDVASGARTRVTSEPSAERFPVWSPNSEQIAFGSNRKDASDVYVKRSSGEGPEELLFSGNQAEAPASWSRDNRSLALMSTGGPSATLGQATGDISVLTLMGDRTLTTFLRTPFVETEPRISPDGRWMAYVSNQSGRGEVYVAPFPGPGLSQPISTAGGTQPQWRRDGSEIFYVASRRLMVAAIKAQGTKLEVGSSRPLFAVAVPVGYGTTYDVTADGQRFLVNSLIDEASTTPITLVVNWHALLKK